MLNSCKNCESKCPVFCFNKWMERVLVMLIGFVLGVGLMLWNQPAPTTIDGEWVCKSNNTTLRVANGCAHFIDNNGRVLGIYEVHSKDDNVWLSDTSRKNVEPVLTLSNVDQQLHVKATHGQDRFSNDTISGVYIMETVPDIDLPIDKKNHIDINVTIPRGWLRGDRGSAGMGHLTEDTERGTKDKLPPTLLLDTSDGYGIMKLCKWKRRKLICDGCCGDPIHIGTGG